MESSNKNIDIIENLYFLGSEFLTWLYFFIDKNDEVKLCVGRRVSLKSPSGSKVIASGNMLDDSGEILQAIQSGLVIESIALELVLDERVFNFTLNSADASISQVKIMDSFEDKETGNYYDSEDKNNSNEKLDDEENLLFRMSSLDDVEFIVDGLYHKFLKTRLSSEYVAKEVSLIRDVVIEGLKDKIPKTRVQKINLDIKEQSV